MMNPERENAYRFVLAAGLLHLKWDLACVFGGLAWLNPLRLRHQIRAVRRAASRAITFHNLAIFSTLGFRGFSEEEFWDEIDRFRDEFPSFDWADYRSMFDRVLAGEEVVSRFLPPPSRGCRGRTSRWSRRLIEERPAVFPQSSLTRSAANVELAKLGRPRLKSGGPRGHCG